jgi:hypothetical protein
MQAVIAQQEAEGSPWSLLLNTQSLFFHPFVQALIYQVFEHA